MLYQLTKTQPISTNLKYCSILIPNMDRKFNNYVLFKNIIIAKTRSMQINNVLPGTFQGNCLSKLWRALLTIAKVKLYNKDTSKIP